MGGPPAGRDGYWAPGARPPALSRAGLACAHGPLPADAHPLTLLPFRFILAKDHKRRIRTRRPYFCDQLCSHAEPSAKGLRHRFAPHQVINNGGSPSFWTQRHSKQQVCSAAARTLFVGLSKRPRLMLRHLTEIIDKPGRDCVYDILCHLDLGLCVDVGAAAGHMTRRIRRAGGARTRVVAFEPFPGNHEFFYRSTMRHAA